MKVLALAAALGLALSLNAQAGLLPDTNINTTNNTPVANAAANQAQGQDQNQGQAQGQLQGQLQGQGQAQNSTNTNLNGQGQAQSSDNTNVNGNANLNNVEGSKASSGSSSGATSGSQAVGNVSLGVVQNYDVAAGSAASVAIAACQQGGSGQGLKGGFGFASDTPQCAALRQAAVDLERAKVYALAGDTEKANDALASYEANVKQAEEAQNIRSASGNFGSVLIDLLPLAALFLVF